MVTKEEQTVRMASKLYEMRQFCRSMWGDAYDVRIRAYMDLVREIAKARDVTTTSAAIIAMKAAQDQGKDVDTAGFGAALIELTEKGE